LYNSTQELSKFELGRSLRKPFLDSFVLAKIILDTVTYKLSTVPRNKVTITVGRHSRMLLAGIRKKSLDARLRGHDGWRLDTHLCGAVVRIRRLGTGLKHVDKPMISAVGKRILTTGGNDAK
jgi:hypothetical protein